MNKDTRTKPISFRPDLALYERMTAYVAAFEREHDVAPPLSQILRVAMSEYLDRKETSLPAGRRAGAKAKPSGK